MTAPDNRRYHLLLKELGLADDEKAALVAAFSDERTTTSTALTPAETAALLRYLQDAHAQKCKPMRGKIIHYLCLLGYTDAQDRADWGRIDTFIQAIGSRNPRKVRLNFLYLSELPGVVTQVQQLYKHETKRVGLQEDLNRLRHIRDAGK